MEDLMLYYTGAVVAIGAVMEVIVRIDKAMDSWSLAKEFTVLGFTFTILQVVGAVISAGASIILTITGSYPLLYAIPGFIAIYFTQYGASKLGWRKAFEFTMNIIKAISKKA